MSRRKARAVFFAAVVSGALVLGLPVAGLAQDHGPAHGDSNAAQHGEDHAGGSASDGDHHGGGHLNFADFASQASIPVLAMLINFGLLLAIVLKLGRKPMAAFLEARSAEIKIALDDAREVRREAEARHRQYSEKLEHLDQELSRLREEIRVAGQAERSRIVAEAQEKAGRLSREVDFLLSQEEKQIKIDLRREAATSALQIAEERLASVTTAGDQERIAGDFLGRLHEAARTGGPS